MNTKWLSFGEYLRELLKKKNLSVADLAHLTNTKSRNSIQRILQEKCSIEIIHRFAEKLTHLHQLELSETELEQLHQSLEVSKVGKEIMHARQVILNAFQNRTAMKPEKPVKIIGQKNETEITLRNYLQSYQQYQEVNILIFNAPWTQFTDELIHMIHKSAKTKVTLEHIVFMEDNAGKNAEVFSSIYRLIHYEFYQVYYTGKIPQSPGYDLYNLMIARKTSCNGESSTDLLKIYPDMHITILSDNPGDHLYQFYLSSFEIIQSKSIHVKMKFNHDNLYQMLINFSELILSWESSFNEFLVKHNMCYQMIPVEILYNMLVDSNFLGLSEDHPYIQKIITITKKRFENYYHTTKTKTVLFTKLGLIDFVKNRVISDHFYQFRPFTHAEIHQILSFVLEQMKKNPNFQLYLLQDDYFIGQVDYAYFEDEVLHLFDSCSGYNENFEDGIITAEPVLQIFDDFIKNELIPHHTLSESESIAFIENLLQQLETRSDVSA